MAAHVHAEKMAMFAEDAKISETPWEFWETKESGVKPVSYHCIVAVSTVLKLINDHIIHIDWASAGLE